jgi:succinate dehydrogenase/fumarate reductase flavoprotein subunit
MEKFDTITDVVVVGSGGAGMVSAWTSAKRGLAAIVVEKASVYGGNTALSGGGAWLPNAPYFHREGERDDPEKLLAYLRTIAPEVAPERQRHYLAEAPKMAAALEQTPPFKKGFTWIRGYSDYHPHRGGNPLGRGLWPTPIDQRVLGEEARNRRVKSSPGRLPGLPKGMWMTSADYHDLISLRWGGLKGYKMLLRLAGRAVKTRLSGQQMITSGAALITRLRMLLQQENVPLWLDTPMTSLITNNAGSVTGIVVERHGKPHRIGARRGVVVASGGFEGSAAMRGQYQPLVRPGLTSGSPDNTGDGIRAGEQIGAALDLMDDAWWMPAMELPGGVFQLMSERSYPHQFIVNGEGKRFVNEASPYTDFGHAVIEGEKSGVKHFPFYMVLDHHAWQHYFFGGLPGRPIPSDWIDFGAMFRGSTLEELADQIGVPRANLVATAARYNGFARAGRDEDFHRGESPYDNWYGNPAYKNPNLGTVEKGPFYAFKMVLSDLGTKGGLLTDEHARVLRKDGSIIPGLYASGNTSAAVMGNSYAGPGATLGPAMTFGWIAAHHMAANDPSDIGR